MSDTPFYREPRFWILLVAILYTLALIGGTHWPREPWPELLAGRRDKLMHLLAYAGLAFFWALAARGWTRPSWLLFAGVAASIAAFGAVDELTQQLVPGRSCDLYDWVADCIGVTFGLGFFALTQAIWSDDSPGEEVGQGSP